MLRKTKWIYLTAGLALVGLAAIGVVLPLLPTTPLLLLAAWCFARSSEKCHRWLLEHKLFGPILRDWHENRRIPLKAKITAIAMILLFGGYAVGFAIENIYLRVTGGLFCLTGLVFVALVPTRAKPTPRP